MLKEAHQIVQDTLNPYMPEGWGWPKEITK